jgi:hypothetical protein
LRRRLRLLANLLQGLRPSGNGTPTDAAAEQRSADELKRRLEETQERLKREHPPAEDGERG